MCRPPLPLGTPRQGLKQILRPVPTNQRAHILKAIRRSKYPLTHNFDIPSTLKKDEQIKAVRKTAKNEKGPENEALFDIEMQNSNSTASDSPGWGWTGRTK